MSFTARFWAKVDKTDGCWLWRSSVTRGYGKVNVGGACQYVHRVAWELQHGPLPPGKFVVQECGVRRCVRHLAVSEKRRSSATLAERFWSKVEKTDGCWLWRGALNDKGYGNFGVRGRTRGAHVVAWELEHGGVPAGMCVLHACDVRNCVRHLFIGTKKDNSEDMVAKGRSAVGARNGMHTQPWRRSCGERNGSAKLSEADVEEIRHACGLKAATVRDMAAHYGVSSNTIARIKSGQRWKSGQQRRNEQMTQTQETQVTEANGSNGAAAKSTGSPEKEKRTPRKFYVVVGDVLEFKSAPEAEKFVNTDPAAPRDFTVIKGTAVEQKQRVSLR